MHKQAISMPILLVMLLVAAKLTTFSQVNTENMLPNSDSGGLSFSLGLTTGLSKGNTEFASLNTTTRIDYSLDSTFTTFLVGNLDYKEGNDNKIANRGFLHYRYIHRVFQVINPELFVQKQFNAFTNLLDRSLGGVGARFVFLDSEGKPDSIIRADLMLGLGIMYEKEVLRTPNRYTSEIPRSTNYLNYKLKAPSGLGFSTIIYYQPNLFHGSDWRFLSTAAISFPLIKGLSLTVNFDYSYDNEPPAGIKKYDLELTNGIKIEL